MSNKHTAKTNGEAQGDIATVPWGSASTVPQKSDPSKYQWLKYPSATI